MKERINQCRAWAHLVPVLVLVFASIHAIGVETEFAGQFNLRAGYGDSVWYGSGELRLMPTLRLGRYHEVSLHHETVYLDNELIGINYGEPSLQFGSGIIPEDDRRVMDLTHVASNEAGQIIYHRLDRLAYTHSADWGSFSIGRSAITWGNGFVFNPMDLFNPFAPTDVERDYKLGADLILLTIYPADWNKQMDMQILMVPRRSIDSGSVQSDVSSLALKTNFNVGDVEWVMLAARHYNESVMGVGRTGYLGDAIWRLDATVTFADEGHHFVSTVANLDYSWIWQGLNYYGSIEFHYNTIGSSDYFGIWDNEPLLDRLNRGELHTLARAYMATTLQIELHALVNLHVSTILNLEDQSAVFLPRLVWNVRQNLEITIGGSLNAGGNGTEFGGIPVPGGTDYIQSPDRAYLWLKKYF